jgi:hypothetical protein
LRCKNEPLVAKCQDPFTVGSPFKDGPDQRRTGNTKRQRFISLSMTNFYRIPKKSFLFQARDDGGRVIRGNFNAGHDFGDPQLS